VAVGEIDEKSDMWRQLEQKTGIPGKRKRRASLATCEIQDKSTKTRGHDVVRYDGVGRRGGVIKYAQGKRIFRGIHVLDDHGLQTKLQIFANAIKMEPTESTKRRR
jgi:hypothetical protein